MIRRATPDDTAALRTLMRTSNGYRDGPERDMILSFVDRWAVTGAADEEIWVEEDESGLAGLHQLIPNGQSDREIDLLFSANDRQGRGVGARLFRHACHRARLLGARRLVIVSNPAASGFYRRMGARDDGVVPASGAIAWERPRLVLDV